MCRHSWVPGFDVAILSVRAEQFHIALRCLIPPLPEGLAWSHRTTKPVEHLRTSPPESAVCFAIKAKAFLYSHSTHIQAPPKEQSRKEFDPIAYCSTKPCNSKPIQV